MTFEKWLQSRLTAHGFPVGLIDGDIGPITTKALQAFRVSRGMPAKGGADEATVKALRLSSSVTPEPRPVGEEQPAPSPTPVVVSPWPKQPGVPAFYGAVGTSQVRVPLPFSMRLAWDLGAVVNSITLHARVAKSAERAFVRIAHEYTPAERADLGLDLFGGSLNVRRMRGGSAYSMHSWGIAIDFDPERNQLRWGRDKARLAKADAEPFWRAWEDEGWVSLGRERNYDWMHIQAARL